MAAMIETKTVKIPKSMDPFYVEINGEKFSYPAGTEQEVPLDVAAVIEEHDANIHKPSMSPAFNQSVSIQPDWNVGDPNDLRHIKNRPFYADTEVLFEFSAANYMGDGAYSAEEAWPIKGGDTVTVTLDGVKYESSCLGFDGEACYFGNLSFLGMSEGADLPFAGMVVFAEGWSMIQAFDFTDGHTGKIELVNEIKTIDPMFIPEGLFIVRMQLDQGVLSLDKTYKEIYNAYRAGKIPVVFNGAEAVVENISVVYGDAFHFFHISHHRAVDESTGEVVEQGEITFTRGGLGRSDGVYDRGFGACLRLCSDGTAQVLTYRFDATITTEFDGAVS